MAESQPVSSSEMTSTEKLDAILKHLEGREAAPKADERSLEWIRIGVPSAIAVVTIAIGFIQYISTSSFSIRQPFLSKQTELCLQASEQTARLASTVDKEQWAKSRGEFWMLYLGPLAVVEEAGTESRVATAMVAFGKELDKVGLSPELPVSQLQSQSLAVAHACRDLLSSKWQAGIMGWFAGR